MSILHTILDTTSVITAATVTDTLQRKFTGTPFIVTFTETAINEFDIHSFIELGLRAVRFKMTNLTIEDKMKLLNLLNKALKWVCEKYNVSVWPVALSIDVPNACIMTGCISKKYKPKNKDRSLFLEENSVVIITADEQYTNECDKDIIYIDDPYSIPMILPGTEITINFGEIQIPCIEKIDDLNVKCKVTKPGYLHNQEFVCIRGIIHNKPPLSSRDKEIIEFAKLNKFDIVTVNSVRRVDTLKAIRKLFKDHEPLLVSTICEQEGLDNLEEIVKESDGIVLAREFLAYQLEQDKMIPIQMYVSGLCRKEGKPFFLTGNILDVTLFHGKIVENDINDITSAVLQGAGFILRKFKDPPHLVSAMRLLNDICRVVEPLAALGLQFWRLAMEFQTPVNAAEATALSAVLLAKMTNSTIIIVPTTTGRTIKQVAHVSTLAVIVAITSNPFVARQLQLFRNVVAIIYDKKRLKNWKHEMEARLQFAISYAIKFQILERGTNYVVLKKGQQNSSYCDEVSVWTVPTADDVMITNFQAAKAAGL